MALCSVNCASFSRTASFKRRHSFVRLRQLPEELCCRAVRVHHRVGGSAPSPGRMAGIFFLNPARISFLRAAADFWRRYFTGEESGSNDPPASQCNRVHPLQHEHKNLRARIKRTNYKWREQDGGVSAPGSCVCVCVL